MANPRIEINKLDVLVTKGKDAEVFLQGQITNDIKIIKDEEKAIYSGYCSPKGRLIAFFLIIKAKDNYYLICPSSIAKEISKKLSMYIMRSEVTFSSEEEISFFSFYGNGKEDNLFKGLLSQLPKKVMQTFKHISTSDKNNYFSITKLPGEEKRFFMLGEGELIKSIYNKLKQSIGVADYNRWNSSDIEAKIPNIFKESQGQFIPQSLNLDILNAVNFKKGCYTGQEIVARTHYLGDSKRRMFQADLSINELFNIGDPILANNNKVGQVVNYYEGNPGSFRLLIEIRIDEAESILSLKNNVLSINLSDMHLFS
jgi:folate-binding protein YgfZ